MLPRASSITSEVRTKPRAEVGERAGSTGGLVRTIAMVGLVCLGLPGSTQAQSFINSWGLQVFDSRWNTEAFVEVAAGGSHTVARRSDGSVVAWGDNTCGECNVPALPAGLTYVEIAAAGDYFGSAHTVARRSDGSVVAWGANWAGQCNVPALPPGLTYVEIAAAYSHTVARRSDGSVVAWGDNSAGQCNVPALPPGLTYVEIAAGGHLGFCQDPSSKGSLLYVQVSHTVARRSDGSVVAWGANALSLCTSSYGQCNVPALPSGLTYVEIAAGEAHTVARRSDGSVVAWGNNYWGQCNVPALPAGLTYVEIAAGHSQTVARRSDGSVVAWGAYSGAVPALPAGLTYVEIAAGGHRVCYSPGDCQAPAPHVVARRSDGSVVAWGDNASYQCNPPPLPAGLAYVEIAAGGNGYASVTHTVARRSDGSVVAWGGNSAGQCNVPALPSGLTYVEVAAGGAHTVARRSDGSVVAWGYNDSGQCNVSAPPAGLTFVEIAAGGAHTVARRSDGSVVAFGDNTNGQCNVPALPAGLTYVEIAAGGSHTVARRSDGSIVAWGDNTNGQCNVPVPPAGLTYVEIGAGGFHTVARLSDGSVWDSAFNVPAPPAGFTPVQVAAGGSHTVARYGLAATVVSVGTGCGGGGMPAFSCNAPRIVQNVTFSLTQGTPNASGFLYYSAVPAAPIVLGSGCTVELDLATFSTLVPVATNATGAWSVTLGPVDPSLEVGSHVALQIALFNTSGPLGIDLSNGVIATVGY